MSQFAKLPAGWQPNGGARKGKAKPAPKPRPAPRSVEGLLEPAALGRRVVLPYPPVQLSPNWRGHFHAVARVKADYRRYCWGMALEAGLRLPKGPAPERIPVRLDFFPPDRRSRDDDNAPAAFKAGRDGIADALRVDDARFVTTTVLRTEPQSCVVVTLLDNTEGEGAR